MMLSLGFLRLLLVPDLSCAGRMSSFKFRQAFLVLALQHGLMMFSGLDLGEATIVRFKLSLLGPRHML